MEEATNSERKAALIRVIEDAIVEAKVYTAPNMLQGRELALVVTKLEEAGMWADRIHAG